MILARAEILKALQAGRVVMDPAPMDEAVDTTSMDLHLGSGLWVWTAPPLRGPLPVEVTDFDYHAFARENLSEVTPDAEGGYVLQPQTVYLGETLERIQFPVASRLAGRVEGKSLLARLGLMVHMTAPLIHCGTPLSAITLEMVNLGPYPLRVQPGKTRICQLLLEEVSSAPEDRTGHTFPES